jgi:hypothetical protein
MVITAIECGDSDRIMIRYSYGDHKVFYAPDHCHRLLLSGMIAMTFIKVNYVSHMIMMGS